jgi:signal transduction histidine kinase
MTPCWQSNSFYSATNGSHHENQTFRLPNAGCILAKKRVIKFTSAGRAIGNLLRNALQSMPDGGQLSLHTACTNDQITFAIKDHGCGIDPEIIGRIFDPFFTTRSVGQGTGLGLSVAQGIISRHGGRIEIASELGKGSCFTIHLPVKYCQPV